LFDDTWSGLGIYFGVCVRINLMPPV
jgi:hypothetical protein